MREFPKYRVVYETFKKDGIGYECVIAHKEVRSECTNFQVIVKHPRHENYFRFSISPSADGHWIPDNKKEVDPWLADVIGCIILNNY